MRKVKRALAAVLAVLMAGSLSACGVKVQTKDDANTTAAVTEAKEETEAVDTPTDEKVTLKIIDWSDQRHDRVHGSDCGSVQGDRHFRHQGGERTGFIPASLRHEAERGPEGKLVYANE